MAGGLLLTPRTAEAQGPAPAAPSTTTGAAPGEATTSRGPDLSPRAERPDDGPAAAPGGPSPDEVRLALADELALGDLLPVPDATSGEAAPGEPGPNPAGELAAPNYAPARHSRWPLTAGLIVTLVILGSGGGFLWWRNRDSQYWPA
jgi:hypothetical protein